MRKILVRSFLVLITAAIIFVVYFAWPRLPIITTYAAKGMCSNVFMADRDPELVSRQDLSFSPISLAKTRVNYEDKSVTATLFGLARRKAVFREGLGATPVVDFSEQEIRAQAVTDLPGLLTNPDTIDWPLGNRLKAIDFPEINYLKMDSVIQSVFDKDGEVAVYKSHAVIVIYKDIPVMEKYAAGIKPDTRLIGWSMSKSITNAMVGILIEQGKLDLSKPAPVPEWANNERNKITLDHLMHMQSGLAWVEDYFDVSDVTKMLYTKGDMYKYAIGRPAETIPGSVWNYSSGTTNIISGIIKNCFTDLSDYHRFPQEALFNRLGMRNTLLEADAAGTFTGSSYCFASIYDWARFGLMFLHNGVFAGDTILTKEWIAYTRQPAEGSDGDYGAQFWLNRGKDLPDCPEDIFYQRGFNGQRVYIIPSHDLIIIRLGYSEKQMDFNKLISGVISSISQDQK